MGIVDDLIANPGLYVGTDTVVGRDLVGAARILVTPLPGGAGVSLDYELFNPQAPGPVLGHVEHTMVGRTDTGDTIMLVAHTNGRGMSLLHESEPGVFDQPAGAAAPYPLRVSIRIPSPGRMRHAWSYAGPGEPLEERDIAELALVG